MDSFVYVCFERKHISNTGDEDEEFTKEELSAMSREISLRLLSLRAAQIAQMEKCDERTEDEILFIQRLYSKIERKRDDRIQRWKKLMNG